MAKATENPTGSTAQFQLPAGWMPILEAFLLVTHIVGAPEVAAQDIWRELVAGRVRALRRRRFDDGMQCIPLTKAFWRDVKLFAGSDARGRDTLCLRPAKGISSVPVSGGDYFFVSRAEVAAAWPVETNKPNAETAGDAIDPFRTGVPGRPSAGDVVLREAKQRITSGEVKPQQGKLAQFARDLETWWENERRNYNPPGPKLSANRIENLVRELWNKSMNKP
jgi:hypothetical protein